MHIFDAAPGAQFNANKSYPGESRYSNLSFILFEMFGF